MSRGVRRAPCGTGRGLVGWTGRAVALSASLMRMNQPPSSALTGRWAALWAEAMGNLGEPAVAMCMCAPPPAAGDLAPRAGNAPARSHGAVRKLGRWTRHGTREAQAGGGALLLNDKLDWARLERRNVSVIEFHRVRTRVQPYSSVPGVGYS